jgi:hypothetical protein
MEKLESIIEENKKERQRLLDFMADLQEKDFGRRLPKGWTITMALGHLAFWDLRQVTLLKRWVNEGVQPGSVEAEAINEAVGILSAAIPPKAIVKLVTDASEAIDRAVAKLAPAQAEKLIQMGFERNLHRALHRKDHLDKIEKALLVS